jgi:ornithine cyclodeaminase/alanine dehydrogenase-like protein (mu-crystallin family)
MEGIVERLGVCAQRVDSEHIAWRKVGGVMRQVEIPAAPGGRFVGQVYLYSTEDCRLLAIMNDSEIQRQRVAGVCGVAAKHLARRDAKVLGLYGSGWQAEAMVMAMKAVRDLEEVRVYSPTREHREAFAARVTERAGVTVRPVDGPAEVVQEADIVSAATNARETVCRGSWLRPGLHVTCIGGSDFDEEAWSRSDLIYLGWTGGHEKHVMDNPRRPDLRYDHFQREGGADSYLYEKFSKRINYLPHLLTGNAPSRKGDGEVTMFQKSGTIQGIEFAATGKVVYDLAVKKGLGREIPDEWFTQSTPQ